MAERIQRTPEQRIADLERQIHAIQRKAAERKTKKSPVLRHVRGAIKAIDKAMKEAGGDQATRTALGEARATLSACLSLAGVLVPAPGGAARRAVAAPSNGAPIASEQLLDYLAAHPGQRGEQIAKALGTESATMRPLMKRLIGEGKVKTQGRARAMAYWPA
jgi:hypothetical protein